MHGDLGMIFELTAHDQPSPKKTKGVASWPRPVEVLFFFLVEIIGVWFGGGE